MAEVSIQFTNHEQIRALFGAHDANLRRVCDAVGIDVVVRGDELRLHGDAAQLLRGYEVIEELRAIVDRDGMLQESEVVRVLSGKPMVQGDVEHDHRAAVGTSVESSVSGERSGAGVRSDLNARSASGSDSAGRLRGEERRVDSPSVTSLVYSSKSVSPRSAGQEEYLKCVKKNDLVFCAGPAGCGKTYLAVAMAIEALRSEQIRKIVLVRPAVEAGEKLGFLPGDLFAKVNPYLRPLLDALNDLLGFETVRLYLEKDVIEIVPLAFMRGRTLNNTFIILDEAQNTTATQMKMFLTRMGTYSQIVVTGDTTQIDLPSHVQSGLTDAILRLSAISGVGMVQLTGEDIVRHRLVREVVRAYEQEVPSGEKSRETSKK